MIYYLPLISQPVFMFSLSSLHISLCSSDPSLEVVYNLLENLKVSFSLLMTLDLIPVSVDDAISSITCWDHSCIWDAFLRRSCLLRTLVRVPLLDQRHPHKALAQVITVSTSGSLLGLLPIRWGNSWLLLRSSCSWSSILIRGMLLLRCLWIIVGWP